MSVLPESIYLVELLFPVVCLKSHCVVVYEKHKQKQKTCKPFFSRILCYVFHDHLGQQIQDTLKISFNVRSSLVLILVFNNSFLKRKIAFFCNFSAVIAYRNCLFMYIQKYVNQSSALSNQIHFLRNQNYL